MITIKNDNQLDKMRVAGKIVGDALKMIEQYVFVGQTPKNLNDIVHDFIISRGATPSFLNYEGFPYSICASVNDEIVHGFATDIPLKDGDIISIDIGAYIDGYHGDAARTFPVGNVSAQAQKLIDVTKQSFFEAIEGIKSGSKVGHISSRVQRYAEKNGFSVVRELAGHGIGENLHEDPSIVNYGSYNSGPILKTGMCIAIEPMINLGKKEVILESNGWVVKTKDGKLSAHYENTIIILENGIEILTI